MKIIVDDLNGEEIFNLLNEHLKDMYAVSPAESVHALDIDELKHPNITFWSIWENEKLAGCGAIKELSNTEAEIKSMRTSAEFRRRGVASTMLSHIVGEASKRNYQTLYLETGPVDYFRPAVELYKRFGFEECGPFADYELDPFSLFMKKDLQ
ncbi:GNAT family N-acetyltransferase [Cellvibrio sp.]|uniref:GNAT family N-acetyltransferase n=1 Tax=Cellvibrio sp. TaxID=1965322 RepID=UPI00396485BF